MAGIDLYGMEYYGWRSLLVKYIPFYRRRCYKLLSKKPALHFDRKKETITLFDPIRDPLPKYIERFEVSTYWADASSGHLDLKGIVKQYSCMISIHEYGNPHYDYAAIYFKNKSDLTHFYLLYSDWFEYVS